MDCINDLRRLLVNYGYPVLYLPMPPTAISTRQEPLEQFSMFLQLDADRPRCWITDHRLRRNMQSATAQLDGQIGSERFWVLYWHRLWRNENQASADNKAASHLCAYLQEACYWAANKTTARLVGLANRYSLSDCFQIAISRYETVLRGFKAETGASLKNYGITVFVSILGETFRQRHEVNICTDWSLLRRLSEGSLAEALECTGHNAQRKSQYILAWRCFLALYAPTTESNTRRLLAPSSETWVAISSFYNREAPSNLLQPEPARDAQIVEQWLLNCAKAVRTYQYPLQKSANDSPGDQDGADWLESLPQLRQSSVFDQVIAEEEKSEQQERQAQIKFVLTKAIAAMDSADQQLLKMYYGDGLIQQEIAKQLSIKQYTVSRRLTRLREALLKALIDWRRTQTQTAPSLTEFEGTGALLDEWLQGHYCIPQLQEFL